MVYFLASVAAIAGFLFGYDEGVIAVARPLLDGEYPMSPLIGGFMTAAVPLGALAAASIAARSWPSTSRASQLKPENRSINGDIERTSDV